MWPKYRLFGIAAGALRVEMTRRQQVCETEISEIQRDLAKVQAEHAAGLQKRSRLEAEMAELTKQNRQLVTDLTDTAQTLSRAPGEVFRREAAEQVAVLAELRAELYGWRQVRARLVHDLAGHLRPYLAQPAPAGPRAKEGVHA